MTIRLFMILTFSMILMCFPIERAEAITNTHAIEGYSNTISVSPGKTITFSVHLPSGHKQYEVEILRFGKKIDQKGNAIGESVAGPFLCNNGERRDYDHNSYVNGAGWPVSFSLKVPSTNDEGTAPCTSAPLPASYWKSGIYTAKITDSLSREYFHITFIVKDSLEERKSIALIASTNTWQAYNFWPGHAQGSSSIYPSCRGMLETVRNKVSFSRPNPQATPETKDLLNDCQGYPNWPYYRTEHLAAGELKIAHWLEKNHKEYSMLTDWDLHAIPDLLDPSAFKTLIISTHSEYWSQAMYNAVMTYVKGGGNLISLSGNTVFWRVTLNQDKTNRTLEKGKNWTPQEQMNLIGLGSFVSSSTSADCTPYSVLRPNHWAFQNIPNTSSIGSAGVILTTSKCTIGNQRGASGWEIDRTDPSLRIFAREFALLGRSQNQGSKAEIIYMRRASAGQVFNVGSITFGQSLMVDQPLSEMMLKVLKKFNSRSFTDFTGDGKPDLLGLKSNGTLWRYDGDGVGGISEGKELSAGWNTFDTILAPGDFDSDGHADVIARDLNGELWLYRGKGNGTIKQDSIQIGVNLKGFDLLIAPGDFDDDGHSDLLARDSTGALWFYRGTGTGSLVQPSNPFNQGWDKFDMLLAPGDFDEDGNPDILARRTNGALWLYRGNGNGSFLPKGSQIDSGWNQFIELITPGDVNGDNHADVLARKADGTLWLYQGLGNGTFKNTTTHISSGWQGFSTVVGVW